MANYRAISSGNWSNLAIWQDDSLGYFTSSLALPSSLDNVFTNNFNVDINTNIEVSSLNNTVFIPPTFLGAMSIPLMTSNNTPSGVASAFSILNSGNQAFQAFDRNTGTAWQSANAAGQWLSYQFTTGRIIKRYGFFSFSSNTNNPRTWTFEGSNNGSTWTTLDTQTNFVTGVSTFFSFDISSNTTSYTFYRINVSAVQGGSPNLTAIPSLEMSEITNLYGGTTAGGSFIFNSGSISGSCTSPTAALNAGATNLIQVTATTGSVTLNLSSNVISPAINPSNLILHSGNCDFNLNGQNFTAASMNSAVCINKSSTGTITVRGNIFSGQSGGQGLNHGLSSTNGNTIIIGSVFGGAGNPNYGVIQTVGNITVTGNVVGGLAGGSNEGIRLSAATSQFTIIGNVTGGTSTNTHGIFHSGTSGSVIGNVTGGSGGAALGISTVGVVTVTGTVTAGAGFNAHGIQTTNIINVTGNVTGNGGVGIALNNNATIVGNVTAGSTSGGIGANNNTSNFTVTVTGTVAASSTALGIAMGGGTGNQIVNLTGNMLNTAGRQAIFSQNLFISDTATTQWRLFTPGGQNKTLYSADTFPNQPSSTNVRSGSLFGPSNVLSGSMVVPSPSDVRVNVLTDNTVGTGQSLTAADFLNEISSSNTAVAQRLRNIATDSTVGSLLTGFNNGGF